jgi:hypothetical protein
VTYEADISRARVVMQGGEPYISLFDLLEIMDRQVKATSCLTDEERSIAYGLLQWLRSAGPARLDGEVR